MNNLKDFNNPCLEEISNNRIFEEELEKSRLELLSKLEAELTPEKAILQENSGDLAKVESELRQIKREKRKKDKETKI